MIDDASLPVISTEHYRQPDAGSDSPEDTLVSCQRNPFGPAFYATRGSLLDPRGDRAIEGRRMKDDTIHGCAFLLP
jgi:hypothetical protein